MVEVGDFLKSIGLQSSLDVLLVFAVIFLWRRLSEVQRQHYADLKKLSDVGLAVLLKPANGDVAIDILRQSDPPANGGGV